MTPHLHIVATVGGRIGVYLPQRPDADANPTVTIRDNAGTALVTAAATTLETVSTTVTLATAAGARSLTVAAAGGVAGRDYELGPLDPSAGTEPTETVRLLSRAAAVLTLARPVLRAHAAAAPLYSTRAEYTVAGAAVPTAFRFGRAEFSYTDRAGFAQVAVVRLDCAPRQHEGFALRHWPRVAVCEQDLFDRFGSAELVIPNNADVRAILRAAELRTLGWLDHRLGRGRNLVAADAIVDAATWWALREMWAQDTLLVEGNPFDAPLDAALSDLLTVGADENQNGTVEVQPREARGLSGLPPP